MKVGIDSVVLGAWAPLRGCKRVLDIGTGSGLLALMLTQRLPAAEVVGIEVDPIALADARHNFAVSPWSKRLRAVWGDVRSYRPATGLFDGIICNPPYFQPTPHTEMPMARQVARHTLRLDPVQLTLAASRLLATDGRFCLIYPMADWQRLEDLAGNVGLQIQERTLVYPHGGDKPHRVLAAFGRKYVADLRERELMLGSPAFQQLTSDFYL